MVISGHRDHVGIKGMQSSIQMPHLAGRVNAFGTKRTESDASGIGHSLHPAGAFYGVLYTAKQCIDGSIQAVDKVRY